MVKRFDITSTPLTKAKPCVVMLLRDNGNIEWYEDAKSGQLMRIKTGNQTGYISLDQDKLVDIIGSDMENLNPEDEIEIHEEDEKGKVKKKKAKMKDVCGKMFMLSSKKKKNLGTSKKPVMGFICHEKSFNPYPAEPVHDSVHNASIIEYIKRNYKSLEIQKIESYKSMIIVVGVIIIVLAFIFFKYSGDWFAAKEVAKQGATAII